VFLPEASDGVQSMGRSHSTAAASLGLHHRQIALSSPLSSPRIHPPLNSNDEHAPRRVILTPRGVGPDVEVASPRDHVFNEPGHASKDVVENNQPPTLAQQLPRHRSIGVAGSDGLDVASEVRCSVLLLMPLAASFSFSELIRSLTTTGAIKFPTTRMRLKHRTGKFQIHHHTSVLTCFTSDELMGRVRAGLVNMCPTIHLLGFVS
jgi:hypothetical protein